MATEYERRFLVPDVHQIVDFDPEDGHELIVQGYLAAKDGAALRIRRRLHLHGASNRILVESAPELDYKGRREENRREEHSWPTPEWIAPRLIGLAKGLVQKRRHPLVTRFGLWDLDIFLVANSGLVIAELETEQPLADFVKPDWCGRDVGDIRAFDNEQLATHPIRDWPRAELDQYGLTYTGDSAAQD